VLIAKPREGGRVVGTVRGRTRVRPASRVYRTAAPGVNARGVVRPSSFDKGRGRNYLPLSHQSA